MIVWFLFTVVLMSSAFASPVHNGLEGDAYIHGLDLEGFPDEVTLELRGEGRKGLPLQLSRNQKLRRDIAITVGEEDGKHEDFDSLQDYMDQKDPGKRSFHDDIAFYHDKRNAGVLSLRNAVDGKEVRGTLMHEGQFYSVEPLSIAKRSDLANHAVKHASLGDKYVRSLKNWFKKERTDHEVYAPPSTDMLDEMNKTRHHEELQPHPNITGTIPDLHLTKRYTSNYVSRIEIPNVFHTEMMMIADYSFYKACLDETSSDSAAVACVVEKFSYFMNGMDLAYSKIQAFRMEIWVQKIYIAKTKNASRFTENYVGPAGKTNGKQGMLMLAALESIGSWYKMTTAKYSWRSYDHYMVLTKADLGRWQKKHHKVVWTSTDMGVAYGDAICIPEKQHSLIEDSDDMTWALCAHELGHNLGAKHDGSSAAPVQCKAQYYLMTPHKYMAHINAVDNVGLFSVCSERMMYNNIAGHRDGWPRVCLFNAVCGLKGNRLTWGVHLPGLGKTPNENCVEKSGNENAENVHASSVCRDLACEWSKGKYIYSELFGPAMEGTTCANKKVCFAQKCVDRSQVESVGLSETNASQNGPFSCQNYKKTISGNPPICCKDRRSKYFISGKRRTCAELVAEMPEYCSNEPAIADSCCASCYHAGNIYKY